MKKPVCIFTVFLQAVLLAGNAYATGLATELTEKTISVDTGFTGARLTLFGVVSGAGTHKADIITVIRGPQTDFVIRRMEKRHLIWTPGPAMHINGAPGFYMTSGTAPVNSIASGEDRKRYALGTGNLSVLPVPENADAHRTAPGITPEAYAAGFFSHITDAGLYRDITGAVRQYDEGLFSVRFDLPVTMPVGLYEVDVYVFEDGLLSARDTTAFSVDKSGLDRRIYTFARRHPALYGLACVVLSLAAGWLASVLFRKWT